MKKLLAFSIVSSSIFFSTDYVRADWDFWAFKDANIIDPHPQGEGYAPNVYNMWDLYKVNSANGNEVFLKRFCKDNTNNCEDVKGFPLIKDRENFNDRTYHIDNKSIIIEEGYSGSSKIYKYTVSGDTLTKSEELSSLWQENYSAYEERKIISIDGDGDVSAEYGNTKISQEGLSVNGENLIKKSSDGVTSIGKNSLKLQESGGLQKMWATDANGNSIPIDITNGTKLLINGRDVEQSINNVGAISAALTGLPTVPTDTTLACGLGTGTHGGDFAFAGGCASKVNDKLSINYAASMTMPGQDYAGDFEDQFSARAGFVWKLGKSTKSSQISMKEKNELRKEISDLKANNKNIISQNKVLLSRLERLEKIALKESKSQDLATIKLP